jgi:GT2 family glycosyltransferase
MLHSVSIIIPTKSRPADLELTVDSILHQSVLPVQLIVVDQSEDDESRRRIETLLFEAPLRVRDAVALDYLRNAAISGGAVARNRAMDIARGDIWLFLDDDVCLEGNFVEELLAVFQWHPRVSGVSGIVSNYHVAPWAYRLWAAVFVRGPFHDERQPIYWKADRFRNSEPFAVRKLGAGLMSFRAESIRFHRFDENLAGVCDGEDVDFCARLGPEETLMIAPRARLVHKVSPIGRSREHWILRFAKANFYLYYRNWQNGLANRFAFAWLKTGLGIVASLASLRRLSLAPWRALLEGTREGLRIARQ